MDRETSAVDTASADRIRILEFQVDHLRRELELLEARHAEAIYSVAWHFGWPVRVIERAIRRALARGAAPAPDAAMPPGARLDLQPPPQPMTAERLAARIARRIVRPV